MWQVSSACGLDNCPTRLTARLQAAGHNFGFLQDAFQNQDLLQLDTRK